MEILNLAWLVLENPKGNRNALKHNARSAETLALKGDIQAPAQMAREALEVIE